MYICIINIHFIDALFYLEHILYSIPLCKFYAKQIDKIALMNCSIY